MLVKPLLTALASIGVALAMEATAIAAPNLDLSQPADELAAFRKVMCSVEDGAIAYFVWQGEAYSRVPGERDRHLFNVQGMSVRACDSRLSETGEAGFRQVTREVMLYLDPQTNEVLETWQNPWTQETNTVVPVTNDPVNSGPFWEEATAQRIAFDSFGDGELLFLSFAIPLFYPNPLGGEYQTYAGGHYHAMEMFNFAVDREELLNPANDSVPVAISWSRISPWLPWMAMGSRPGELVFNAIGARVESWEQLPEPLRGQVETTLTLYQAPPPLDDDRPNQTTWSNFREYLDSQPSGAR